MNTFDISDDSSYQDEESSESNKSEFKIKQDRKHQLGGRTVSSLSVPTAGNQIYLVTLRPTQLTQASFLQKNQMLQNVFLILFRLR